MYYNRYRYYDPDSCSFISQDPLRLGAGTNLYRYAPNVWGWADPLGLCKTDASNNKPDFYVGPGGPEDTLPSTAYRYDRYLNDDGTPNKWGKAMIANNEGQVTYLGFEKYDTGTQAADAFQMKTKKHVNPLDPADSSWSDARLRGEFDTLQLYENGQPKARVPREFGDKVGADPEPFTKAYPAYGDGGAQQLHADRKNIKFDKVDILPEK